MRFLAFPCPKGLVPLQLLQWPITFKMPNPKSANQREQMGLRWLLFLLVSCLGHEGFLKGTLGFACNWGTQSSHPLPPDIVVKLIKENGFDKVKLFEADPGALQALGNSGLHVMLGIPNEFLAPLASSVRVAEEWVSKNVSYFVSNFGTDIRYVAVGNEPFLNAYNGSFHQTTFPALQNIQAALIKAGLGRQVKVTVPLNADVYETENGLPSGGNFRPDILDLMVNIIKFLNNAAAPITINIYPFLSLNADPHFPKEYAFFNGNAAPVVDGSISYTNVLDANFDTLVTALEKNGFSSMPIIIGEVGWPTDGDSSANKANAQRFNQGLIDRINRRQGTPKRPIPIDTYIFAIIDEDAKSIQPGSFERHWGIFNYDGTLKYSLNLGKGKSLVPARGVRYLSKQWCVMSPQASLSDPNLPNSVAYACDHADCTSLGYGSSCDQLDAKSNVSYAFNAYFQTMNQSSAACKFSNLATISTIDPSPPSQGNGRDGCRFGIMIDTSAKRRLARPPRTSSSTTPRIGQIFHGITLLLAFLILILKI